jgi:hypothetical protein
VYVPVQALVGLFLVKIKVAGSEFFGRTETGSANAMFTGHRIKKTSKKNNILFIFFMAS